MQIGQAEYPATVDSLAQDRWAVIRQGYTAPDQAATARLELVYRWDADGAVYFGGVSFRPETRDPSRRIKLATIYHRPENTAGVLDNLKAFAPLLERAAEGGADIICMPEGINLVGTGMDYVSAGEEIPGRATDFLGKIAARHACYIVAGLFERDGPIVYNTAVLIDRSGAVAGKYRKVSLPREEIEGGITPGDRLPVFETDFGTIGLMICWDVTFPEVARNLASKGAEVILMPIWGGNITLTRARAIENQVFLVTSGYDIRTAIFDKEGEVLAEATRDTPVAVFEVDLNQRLLWPWLGDLRNRIPREKPSARVLYPDGGYDQ
jgi:predicted amidohydrolase